jgi:hypothetical protein
MAELMFVRMREINEWEGATWDWWLQLTGNVAALKTLEEILGVWYAEDDDGATFMLHRNDVEPEHVVDKLVQYATEDYFPAHNKVVGVFTCPDDLGERAELLYKGAIRSCFKAASDG